MDKQREERIIGWKAIAAEAEVPEWTLKHRLYRAGLRFPKLNSDLPKSPVYTTRKALRLVLAIILG